MWLDTPCTAGARSATDWSERVKNGEQIGRRCTENWLQRIFKLHFYFDHDATNVNSVVFKDSKSAQKGGPKQGPWTLRSYSLRGHVCNLVVKYRILLHYGYYSQMYSMVQFCCNETKTEPPEHRQAYHRHSKSRLCCNDSLWELLELSRLTKLSVFTNKMFWLFGFSWLHLMGWRSCICCSCYHNTFKSLTFKSLCENKHFKQRVRLSCLPKPTVWWYSFGFIETKLDLVNNKPYWSRIPKYSIFNYQVTDMPP